MIELEQTVQNVVMVMEHVSAKMDIQGIYVIRVMMIIFLKLLTVHVSAISRLCIILLVIFNSETEIGKILNLR